MKRRFWLPLLSALLALSLAACGGAGKPAETTADHTEPETEEETSVATEKPLLRSDVTYTASAEKLFTFRSSDPEYYTVQGGHFNGEYFYVAEILHGADGHEKVRILELDIDGELLRESDPLLLDHANNISYVPKWDALLVTHCQAPEGHNARYSLVDPETFEITETDDLEYPFFAMAYCPSNDRFASGEWSGQTLDVWDGDMNPLLHRDVEYPGSLSQGVFANAEGIWFVRSSQNGYPAEIRVYDWDLNLLHEIPLKLSGNIEPESINIVDGEIYVIGTDWSKHVGTAFLVELTPED